jgi:hypothetical protein
MMMISQHLSAEKEKTNCVYRYSAVCKYVKVAEWIFSKQMNADVENNRSRSEFLLLENMKPLKQGAA